MDPAALLVCQEGAPGEAAEPGRGTQAFTTASREKKYGNETVAKLAKYDGVGPFRVKETDEE